MANPRLLLAALFLAWIVPFLAAAQGTEPDVRLEDRLVAVVDDDPIFLSDVDRLLALGLVDVKSSDDVDTRRRAALDRLIEERLRLA